MISFRYHIVSLAAVFLAVGLGIAIGASGLRGAVLDDLHKQVKSLKAENGNLRDSNDTLNKQVNNADDFAAQYGGKILENKLSTQTVVLVSTPGADSKITDNVASAIALAGGKVTGRITLTGDYVDPGRGADITKLATSDAHPEGLQLPESTDPMILGGALLGYVLSGKGTSADLNKVISAFAALSMLKTTGDPAKANLAVLVTSGAPSSAKDPTAKAMLSLLTEFSQYSLSTVVAGNTDSAGTNGVVAAVRGDAIAKVVSTVDNADTAVGQVACALALSGLVTGIVGQYGTGPGAKSQWPSPPK